MTADVSIHPRFQARILARAEETKRRSHDQYTNCIASLEYAIVTLRKMEAADALQDVELLANLYEWAWRELRDCDPDDARDAKRIAGVTRLLRCCRGAS